MSTRHLAQPGRELPISPSTSLPLYHYIGHFVRACNILSVASWGLLLYWAAFAPATLDAYMWVGIAGSIGKLGSVLSRRAWIDGHAKAARLDGFRAGRLAGVFEEAAALRSAATSIQEGRSVR